MPQDDCFALTTGERGDGTVQCHPVEDALGPLDARVVDEFRVPRTDPSVAVAVRPALPDAVDRPTVRDRPDPRDRRVRRVEPVGDLPELEEHVLDDLLRLPRVHQLVTDVPFDERPEALVQPGEGITVTSRDGEEQRAFFVALGEQVVVHPLNVTYGRCTCKYTLDMRRSPAQLPARRTTPKGLATRRRIVDAAAGLLLTRGIAGTTLDDIGAAATVGRSQLYHYFVDKQELVRDVVRQQTDAIIARQGLDDEDLTTFDAWQRWRDRTVRGAEAGGCVGGCPLGTLGSEVAERDTDTRDLVAAGFARWEQAFRDGLGTMRDRGLLDPDADPAALATAVLVALQGGLLLAQVQRDVRPLAIGLDTALEAIRRHAAGAGAGVS